MYTLLSVDPLIMYAPSGLNAACNTQQNRLCQCMCMCNYHHKRSDRLHQTWQVRIKTFRKCSVRELYLDIKGSHNVPWITANGSLLGTCPIIHVYSEQATSKSAHTETGNWILSDPSAHTPWMDQKEITKTRTTRSIILATRNSKSSQPAQPN